MAMNSVRLVTPLDNLSDEELMGLLADGHEDALAPLHSRYASLIFGLAARSLDPAAAEEIVQDVFLTLWNKASSYDSARGPVRPWLLRIAHLRVINELRRRGRRPAVLPDPEGARLATVPDQAPQPDEAAWREFRRTTVQAAVAALPPAQRQALSLAFFDDLTHEQVATFLGLPLGTAKTRIRTGMQHLRTSLVPLLTVLALVLAGGLVALGTRLHDRQTILDLNTRALQVVTSSDTVAVRLVAAPGVDPASHGEYRSRPGDDLAVLTASYFVPAPAGHVYQAWARYGERWESLGIFQLNDMGHGLLLVDQHGRGAPQALEVTEEPGGGSAAPTGPVVVSWTRS
ncbi:MAG: sigma-70 family RNA polymerase sigma factor [Thermomicrobiales bacterium]